MISNYVHVSKKLEAHKKHRLILQSTVIYQYTANIRPDVKKKISSELTRLFLAI